MRRIERVKQFRRDYRREQKGPHRTTVNDALAAVLDVLVADPPLDARLSDHALSGHWNGYRDCHIRPDLVLIYQKIGTDVLRLMRLGSHAALDL